MVAKTLIKIDHLSKYFNEGGTQRVVLTDISLEINKGDFIVLLGRSGSGKSTLLNLMSGIDTPSAGRVLINGTDLTGMSEHDRTLFRRHNVGFIFQLFNLIPTLTVQENIMLPLELTGRLKRGHKEHVHKLLTALKLDDRANSFPDKLSGGEQQRVAILRALIHQPELLLADEPTGNLDTDSSKTVLNLLQKLVKKEGKTLVLVTHNQEIAQMADHVYQVRDGKLVANS